MPSQWEIGLAPTGCFMTSLEMLLFKTFSATLIGGNSGWRVCGSNGGFGYKATRFRVLGFGFPQKARQSEAADHGWGHTGE